jgi:hypothetical protein
LRLGGASKRCSPRVVGFVMDAIRNTQYERGVSWQ